MEFGDATEFISERLLGRFKARTAGRDRVDVVKHAELLMSGGDGPLDGFRSELDVVRMCGD